MAGVSESNQGREGGAGRGWCCEAGSANHSPLQPEHCVSMVALDVGVVGVRLSYGG